MMTLTELDKTILLAMLVFTKGSTRVAIKEDQIVLKFPMRKRVLVRESLSDLTKNKLIEKIEKSPKDRRYRLTEDGKEQAAKILHQGAKLWYMK